jgi:hypothetical protein
MPDSLRSTGKVFCFRRESYRPNATLRITRLKANRPEKSQAACQPSSTSREERVCPALVPHKTPIVFILGSCQSSTRQVTRFGLLQSNVLSMPAAEPANVLVRIPVCRLRRLAPTGGAPDIADRSLCTQRRAPSLATLRLHQDRSSGMPFLSYLVHVSAQTRKESTDFLAQLRADRKQRWPVDAPLLVVARLSTTGIVVADNPLPRSHHAENMWLP